MAVIKQERSAWLLHVDTKTVTLPKSESYYPGDIVKHRWTNTNFGDHVGIVLAVTAKSTDASVDRHVTVLWSGIKPDPSVFYFTINLPALKFPKIDFSAAEQAFKEFGANLEKLSKLGLEVP